jgi:hypothetical protein
MDIINYFMDKLCWDIFIDHVHPCMDIDSKITCGFISKIPVTFNKKYFEMRMKYVIARIPPFIHIGGLLLHNAIELTIPITTTKIMVIEISEYHDKIHISDQDSYWTVYEEYSIT